jgi:hypothetical protein
MYDGYEVCGGVKIAVSKDQAIAYAEQQLKLMYLREVGQRHCTWGLEDEPKAPIEIDDRGGSYAVVFCWAIRSGFYVREAEMITGFSYPGGIDQKQYDDQVHEMDSGDEEIVTSVTYRSNTAPRDFELRRKISSEFIGGGWNIDGKKAARRAEQRKVRRIRRHDKQMFRYHMNRGQYEAA